MSTATETTEIIAPRHDSVTATELLRGKANKRDYVASRIAAGAQKAAARSEFEAAVAEKNRYNTVAAAALIGSGDYTVTRLNKTKSGGFTVSLKDTRQSKERAAERAEAQIQKLRQKLAEAEAKLAASAPAAK